MIVYSLTPMITIKRLTHIVSIWDVSITVAMYKETFSAAVS